MVGLFGAGGRPAGRGRRRGRPGPIFPRQGRRGKTFGGFFGAFLKILLVHEHEAVQGLDQRRVMLRHGPHLVDAIRGAFAEQFDTFRLWARVMV
jgi:hypothetical protein